MRASEETCARCVFSLSVHSVLAELIAMIIMRGLALDSACVLFLATHSNPLTYVHGALTVIGSVASSCVERFNDMK